MSERDADYLDPAASRPLSGATLLMWTICLFGYGSASIEEKFVGILDVLT